jgi:hypothetical protein
MPYRELKSLTLRNEKFQINDVSGAVLGIRVVDLSGDIGLFVVLVARNRTVNLKKVNFMTQTRGQAHITFFGCQSMTVFFR